MSTSQEIRNARKFAQAQQCYDDRLPSSFFDDDCDDEFSLQMLAGVQVNVVFNWAGGEVIVIGVDFDGELVDVSNFSQHVVRGWTKAITRELT